jgi:hypothetical protein
MKYEVDEARGLDVFDGDRGLVITCGAFLMKAGPFFL